MPKYYVEGCHEPIIDRSVFLLVQEEMARRASLRDRKMPRMYSSKYALSGIVFCPHCGGNYRRVVWNIKGEKVNVWRCTSRLDSSAEDCPARTLHESDLHEAVCTAVNTCWANRDTVIPALKENIESVVGTDYEDEIEVIDEMIRKKQKELLDAGRDESRIDAIGDKIISLRERRSQLLTQAALHRDEADKIKLMIRYIEEQDGKAEYSESLVRRLVSKITVYDNKVTVEFKTGLSIDVEV